MNIITQRSKPTIQDLPGGNTVLFFAKINEEIGFCVIYGIRAPYPHEISIDPPQFVDVKIALGQINEEMEVHHVYRGHSNGGGGGGFVEFETEKGPANIAFYPVNHPRSSRYNYAQIIEKENIYVCI